MRSRIFRYRYLLIVGILGILVVGALLFAATFISGPTVLQEGVGYADPDGRFTAPIPAGWANASTDQYGLFTKGDTAIYLLAVEAADVQAGVDAALALVAPEFDRSSASRIGGGDAPAVNGVWQENIYQAADSTIYYADTQVEDSTAYLVIFTAPNMVELMRVINDAHAVIVGVDFAWEVVVEATPTTHATPAPLPTIALTFPNLTGQYAVGRTVYSWVDDSREEVYSEDQADKRALTVWAWYPAEPAADAQPAPYLPEAMSEALARILNVNAPLVSSHAYADAPVSAAQPMYPVLVFSHGNQSNSAISTAMLEEIASHGYIIFGIDHTYNALLTTLPNGEVIRAVEAATPETAETLAVRVADVRFVLDQLETLNAGNDALAGRLDLERLGLIGHSYGGATVAEACHEDARCQAVAVMDVPLRGEVASVGLSQPILLMDSEKITCDLYIQEAETIMGQTAPVYVRELCEVTNTERAAAAEIALAASSGGYHVSIVGTRHQSFTDIAFMIQQQPALQANLGGFTSIEAQRGWRVSSDFLLAFIGEYLRGETTALLNGPNPDYPEVAFESAAP
jgi:predicted dienelactone hydrolase